MSSQLTLIQAYWPVRGKNLVLARNILLIALGTALLTLSAKIQIPFWPVPTTMQSFMVVVLGALYGPRLGAATLVAYLLEGAAGLPVFAGDPWQAPGFGYFLHPTGGYLIGFVLSAYVVGVLSTKQWGKTPFSAGLLFIVGFLVIEIPGALWLFVNLGWAKTVAAVLSYQLASALKIGLGMGLLPLLWQKCAINSNRLSDPHQER